MKQQFLGGKTRGAMSAEGELQGSTNYAVKLFSSVAKLCDRT